MALFGYRAEDFAELGPRIRQAMSEIYNGLQKRLTFRENVNMMIVTHTFGAVANTTEDVSLTSLNIPWTPTYFMVIEIDRAGTVYPNDVAHTGWTNGLIKAKCSVASAVVKLAVF
jgi:broad specificity phosphatase PhoE